MPNAEVAQKHKETLKVKLQEITDTIEISKEYFGFISPGHLSTKKLFSKEVSLLFTVDQKEESVDDSTMVWSYSGIHPKPTVS